MSELVEIAIILGIVVPSLGMLHFFCMLVVCAFQYYRAKGVAVLEQELSTQLDALVNERAKVETLLSRTLPRAEDEADGQVGEIHSQRYNIVTVLYADIEGFGLLTDSSEPEKLVDSLDRFFYDLDGIVAARGIEKIKTLGDAYVCAGGVPDRNRTNPIEVILVALAMQVHMARINSELGKDAHAWGLRIGVHTGPVMLISSKGRDRTMYDIWGGTASVASRLESSGKAGMVNISDTTYALVKDFFDCSPRGEIPVKNKGKVAMYCVNRIKPQFSADATGIVPNDNLFLQLQFIRLNDLEELMFSMLEERLPSNLYFHNLKHTIDVYAQVELIGREEALSEEDILLLRTAALFHDAGLTVDYETYKEMGVKLLRDILPHYNYTSSQIERIAGLIRSTSMPLTTDDKLAQVFCDADFDYLGRSDYFQETENLYREMTEQGMAGTRKEWIDRQVMLMEQHQYYTETARTLRGEMKRAHLQQLLRMQSDYLT